MPKAKGSKHNSRYVTDMQVKRFKGPGRLTIGNGLYFVVTPSGNRRWVFRFTFAGKQQELFLAPESKMTLAEARKAQGMAMVLVRQGTDPRQEMDAKARRLKQHRAAGIPTFGELADDYLQTMDPTFKNVKAKQPWELSLKTYAAPIRSMRVNTVTPLHMVEVLKPIWHLKPETARRVRARIEAVFRDAIVKGYRNTDQDGNSIFQRNPAEWRNNLDQTALKRSIAKVQHHPALPYCDVPTFIADLRSCEGLAARALELCILTATRTSEAIGACWSEFDLIEGVWTIPAGRMKAGREHAIPLSNPALAIVKAAPQFQGSPFVFPGLTGKSHLSNMAMSMLLRRMGQGGVTVHGFRSSFRDWVSEVTQFPQEVAEMALAHVIESRVERAYRRGDLFEKRKALMAAWADYCSPDAAENVVKLGKRQ